MITPTKDITLYETGSGGDLYIENNDIQMSEQLIQCAYLCLFGGNVEASTKGNEISGEIRNDWWANSLLFSDRPNKQFNSSTERTLNTVALNMAGRLSIKAAVEQDLVSMSTFAEISVEVYLLSKNRAEIQIKLKRTGSNQTSVLQLLWDNAKKEIIIQKTI